MKLSKNMPIILDTNTLIRFFTNDIPQKAEKVEHIIENQTHIIIPDVVFPELEYVLLLGYNTSRSKILEAYQFLISHNHIKTSSYIKSAVTLFENSNLDMADCIIAAQSQKGKLASFDKDLLKIPGIHPFWKKES